MDAIILTAVVCQTTAVRNCTKAKHKMLRQPSDLYSIAKSMKGIRWRQI